MNSPQIASKLTPEEEFYLEWGRETQKAGTSAALDTLQRLMSLNGTMLGGSLLLWQSSSTSNWARPTCCFLFLTALISAFLGMLPSYSKVDLGNPAAIKLFKINLLRQRYWWVRISALFTSLAFLIALIALVAAPIQVLPQEKMRQPPAGSAQDSQVIPKGP